MPVDHVPDGLAPEARANPASYMSDLLAVDGRDMRRYQGRTRRTPLEELAQDRTSAVAGYPLPIVVAEKITTAVQRGTTNTRGWRDIAPGAEGPTSSLLSTEIGC